MKMNLLMKFILLLLLQLILVRSTAYDKHITLFSQDGNLHQVEYAYQACLRGGSVLCGICQDNQVLLCIPTSKEKRLLQDDTEKFQKIAKINENAYISFAGLNGDGKALIRLARKFSIEYKSKFGLWPSTQSLAEFIGSIQHKATLTGGSRPFGVQVLVIGSDSEKLFVELYIANPSGEVVAVKAFAIGKSSGTFSTLLSILVRFNFIIYIKEIYLKYLEDNWKSQMSSIEAAQVFTEAYESENKKISLDKTQNESLLDFYLLHRSKTNTFIPYKYLSLQDLINEFKTN